jgi:membrane fusion protein (multidrug efflux system)
LAFSINFPNALTKITTTAKTKIKETELKLSYTTIAAPSSGRIGKKNISIGQFVQAGTPLFSIVNDSSYWIVANFKETQLNKMVIGQKVTVKVDAYPDTDFEGTVTSFSPATGSRFSLLPPDNATGNFVKTIQRLPVKISLSPSNDAVKMKNLRSGMNAEVDVHIK